MSSIIIKEPVGWSLYTSTRGGNESVGLTSAILDPAAENGGLYVPSDLAYFDLLELQNKSYIDLAFAILKGLKIDQGNNMIFSVLKEAYANFDNPENPAPVHILNKNLSVCELYHGPTRAFKDMALQPFMALFSEIAQVRNESYIIMAATSGDTGPAVLDAISNKRNLKAFVMYPHDGTSKVQELQMTTQSAKNVKVIGINGNFDDAQSSLKSLMRDEDLKNELHKFERYNISAANSVNFARIAFQIVYHFWSYFKMIEKSSDFEIGNSFNSIIPSGNFGNALAAFYAKKMGLPINKIVIATNDNDVLSYFISTGVYDLTDRELIQTNSPAMDILKSSNVERVLYELFGSKRTRYLMEELEENNIFYLDDEELIELNKYFIAESTTQKEVIDEIATVKKDYDYIIDPHTATAFVVQNKLLSESSIANIIYSTAEWTKFAPTIGYSLKIDSETKGIYLLKEISNVIDQEITSHVSEIFSKKEIHTDVVDISDIDMEVMRFMGLVHTTSKLV